MSTKQNDLPEYEEYFEEAFARDRHEAKHENEAYGRRLEQQELKREEAEQNRQLQLRGIWTDPPMFELYEGPELRVWCTQTVGKQVKLGSWTQARPIADGMVYGFWTIKGKKAIERAVRAYAPHAAENTAVDTADDKPSEEMVILAEKLGDWLAEAEPERQEPERLQPERQEPAGKLVEFPRSTHAFGLYDRLAWAEKQTARGSAASALDVASFPLGQPHK